MKTAETTNKPDLQVSKETANFIGCLQQMQTLYSCVYAALETLYDDETAHCLINDYFYTEFKALEKCVSGFLVDSISEKLGEVGNTEI
ncbi:MAG: hypothetical protein PHX61_00700 [Alphaproteobacteria bacterium]|nr:hypothetical protein [Alphaproteobacteria bacterium]